MNDHDDPLICFCFNVSKQTIIEAIIAESPGNVHELTQFCKAGNGCTSCWADLEDLIQRYSSPP